MFIDSHCHLDFQCFEQDREQIMARCQILGVNTIVIPGTQFTSWANQISLCKHYPQLRFALGLHPYFLADFELEHLDYLRSTIVQNIDDIVALGEIGLDAAIDVNWATQVKVFLQQLSIAEDCSLPVIVHHRNSHNELIRLLKQSKFTCGGIVHAFSGSLQQAQSYVDLGFKIGVGGGITYPRAKKTIATLSQLPLSSLVLETDAPDMPIMGKQGMRNSPEYLPEIFEALLSIRHEPQDVLAFACSQNVRASLKNLSE